METLKALFGEWLPDMPDLDNPGITEALNVVASDGGYVPFRPLSALSDALPATGLSATAAATTVSSSEAWPIAAIIPSVSGTFLAQSVYAANAAGVFRRPLASGSGDWTLLGFVATDIFSFTQFDDLVIAAGNEFDSADRGAYAGRVTSVGSTMSALVTSGTDPCGNVVGVVGRFVVLGRLHTTAEGYRPNAIRWSAIDEPRNWPVPNTSTATATQAGEQLLSNELGAVTGIFGTDQYGIVMQEGGITRMQYIGGNVVFQFDKVESTYGCPFRKGAILVGGLVYFASRAGFFVTDGVSVVPIGDQKVNKLFIDTINENGIADAIALKSVWCGYDKIRDVIYWAYGDGGVYGQTFPATANKILLYHIASKKWTHADYSGGLIVTPDPGGNSNLRVSTAGAQTDIVADLYAFNTSRMFCRFSGTAGAATFITSEQELLPGRYSYVDGVKPLIEYTSTAPAITVSIGSRNDQSDASLSFSGTTTPTTDTGFADFRDSARYHRAKIQVTGNFKKATGLEWRVKPEGER